MNFIRAGLLSVGCLTAWASLAHAESSRLDQIVKSKTLTVCTTGDYPPYSFRGADQQYQGLDIVMVQSLAQSLAANIRYVPSTWKTLMPDFLAQQCDIAVGGISVTLKRQQQAWFAEPLGVDGKVPLVRCNEHKKYYRLEHINQPQVRVIEPEGGTNELFARRYLSKAQIRLHDNVTIFDELVHAKADVMITDASEALYQQQLRPSLCALNVEKPLQFGEKAYLLPKQDLHWKMYVDQWLHLSQASGDYERLKQQYLPKRYAPQLGEKESATQ